jgi:hypothetical protein
MWPKALFKMKFHPHPLRLSTVIFLDKLLGSIKTAVPPALKSAIWLVKLTIPISLGVTLLNYLGVVGVVAEFLNPAFGLMGLPGEASLVFITAIFLNIYSAIAVISQLPLSIREITILAVMCLIAHNLIVETAVQMKTGSKGWHMVTLRLSMAVLSGFMLNWMLPEVFSRSAAVAKTPVSSSFFPLIQNWAEAAFLLTLKIVILVTLLMVLQQILKDFGLIKWLSRLFQPLLSVFGLPHSTSFMWIVANTLGLAYGSAAMVQEVKNGNISTHDADLLNHHIAISHSNLEDLLLFAAIGVPVAWILVPRLVFAAMVVWGKKLYSYKG